MSKQLEPVKILELDDCRQTELETIDEFATYIDLIKVIDDPELPGVSIWDLGLIRDIQLAEAKVILILTPTYQACPAIHVIQSDLHQVFQLHGYQLELKLSYFPVWQSSWMTVKAWRALRALNIGRRQGPNATKPLVHCVKCGASGVSRLSEFGSTSCQAIYRCETCFESFSVFKHKPLL